MQKGTHKLNEIVRVCCCPNMEFVLRGILLGLELGGLNYFLVKYTLLYFTDFCLHEYFFPFLTGGTGIQKRLLVKFLFF